MTDNQEIIKCPACGKDMTKVYMKDAGVNVDICLDGCGGLYFDNRELEKFDEKHENIQEILEAIQGKQFQAVDNTSVRYCPCCYDMPMTKMGAAGGAIEIDVCNNCGGKFLDSGELKNIRETQVDLNDSVDKALDAIYDFKTPSVNVNKRRAFFVDLVSRFI